MTGDSPPKDDAGGRSPSGMDRRAFVGAVVTAGVAGLAGCSGLGSNTEGEERSRQRQLDRQNATITELERELDRAQQRLAERNETVADLQSDATPNAELLRRYYDEAYESYAAAKQPFFDGTQRYEEGEYIEAAGLFGTAEASYQVAGDFFREAVFLARDAGYESAESVASEASFYCTQRRLAADRLDRAATAYAAGRTELGDERAAEAEPHREEADEYDVAAVDRFAAAVAARDK